MAPICSCVSSSQAAFLVSGSSGPQKKSHFLAPGLALQKPGHFTQHLLVLPLYASVLLVVEQHSTLRAHAFLLVPLCPFGMGTESSCCCLEIYQRKQMSGALFLGLMSFLVSFLAVPGLCSSWLESTQQIFVVMMCPSGS